jgi:hypothetical protein
LTIVLSVLLLLIIVLSVLLLLTIALSVLLLLVILSRLVISTRRTVGSAKKFVRKTPKEEGQTMQWSKEEGQTIQ